MNRFIYFIFLFFGQWNIFLAEDENEEVKSVSRKNKKISGERIEEKKDILKELREKEYDYQERHEKYLDLTKDETLQKYEIQHFFKVVTEIDLSVGKNKDIIGDIDLFIKTLLDGIKRGKIKAFENENFSDILNFREIKEKMLKPRNPELNLNEKEDKHFEYEDISLIEIDSNYVKSTKYPLPILDHLALKIEIPGNMFNSGIPKIICCFKYYDLIDFLKNEEYKINIKGTKIFLSDINFEKVFDIRYKFIDGINVNATYNISKNDFYRNNKISEEILKSKMQNFCRYV